MCVTDDDRLADRIRLIRNHGESIVDATRLDDLTNLVGFNFRMTELSAAIGIEQLRKLDRRVASRIDAAERLTDSISDLDGLVPPAVRDDCEHAFYVWAPTIDESALGLSRSQLSQALAAEGLPHGVGYVRPLYQLPLFQRRVAIGAHGFPFNLGTTDYSPGLCPVAEQLYERTLLLLEICSYDMSDSVIEQVAAVFRRVHAGRHMLRDRLEP
jgi:dTDP-4-amino-4,6-dideoxygalactose transaminase